MITPPPGFDIEGHRRHIEAGGCPYVDYKTWCNGRNDDLHQDHWAMYRHGDGRKERVGFDPASPGFWRAEAANS